MTMTDHNVRDKIKTNAVIAIHATFIGNRTLRHAIQGFTLHTMVVRARILYHSRRETAFSPESTTGPSEAKSSRSPFCVAGKRRGS